MSRARSAFVLALIAAAAAARLLPHPPNFAPITAIALFGGATLEDRRLAFLVPLAAMLLSDMLIGLHAGMPMVYAAFALIVCIGLLLRRRGGAGHIAAATLGSSALFFALSNLHVWASGGLYPRDAAGLLACFTAALPFFGRTILGDAFYTAALFGGLTLAERCAPALRRAEVLPR